MESQTAFSKAAVESVPVHRPCREIARNNSDYSLYHGRSRKPLVRVVHDEGSSLYRVAWPDIGLSPHANLTRCMNAAREWAERTFLTDHRKMSGARRLKSLGNFWWSASPIEKSGPEQVKLPRTAADAAKLSPATFDGALQNFEPAVAGHAHHGWWRAER